MSFLRSEGGGILAEEIFYEELILCPKRKQKKNRKNPLKINVEIKKKKEQVSNYLIFFKRPIFFGRFFMTIVWNIFLLHVIILEMQF